ncbi:uncharacterized protein PV09_01234 [Verruconis gallopava]|uniref:Uncharacterized protein n=1 Tax=Verruconis gallopava TaxID=253628 RepID=A0A0D2AP39_9PEZI|nr:uncharacterized protein PV09_01234 [Verruconis gallopava]KIW08315.1 hypothetical protein PV09_01234 [Verruconis gallopava]
MSSSARSLPVRPRYDGMETTDSPCVLLLDLSHSALAGIDLLSFTTTPKFKGIKNLPPGLHFVFCSTSSDLSVRHGAWFEVPANSDQLHPLFVKRWNASTEQLEDVTDVAEILRWRANLGSIWREGLSPYRQTASQEATEEKSDWSLLTDRITASLLSKLLGETPNHWSITSASSSKEDLEVIPGISMSSSVMQAEKELGFLPIDLKRPWREGATGRERTEAALDHSWYLRELLEKHCLGRSFEHILGEMQFCFLMVLTLNNYSCLEQWKRLLSLLLTCKSAVSDFSAFYVKFLAQLRVQLQNCQVAEGGLFDLADESGSLLKGLLHKFKFGLRDISGAGKSDVMDELDELENFLRDEHGWELDSNFVRKGLLELEDGEKVEMDVADFDEEDESGEYAPTVVQLTEEQMEELGIVTVDPRTTQAGHAQGITDPKADDHMESEDDQDLEDMDTRY